MNIKNTKLVKRVFSAVTSVAVISAAILPATITIASPVQAASELEFTNTVDKDFADRGDNLNYTITIKNSGDKNMDNAFVWINQPNLANYISGSSKFQGFPGGSLKTLTDNWIVDGVNFGTIPAGKWVVLNYQTAVASNANPGDIIWSAAFAKSDQNAKVQASSSTEIFFENPSLCSSKSADKEVYAPGETVKYTIEVCNNGNVLLENIRMFDELPDEVSYVNGTASYNTTDGFSVDVTDAWVTDGVNLGHLGASEKGFFKFEVKINDDVKDGTVIRNAAKLKSDQTEVWIECSNEIEVKVVVEEEVGKLKIFKYEDANGNAVLNKGEKALSGFKFTVKGNGFEKTVTTGADGVIVINNLEPGTYTITETVPAGWRITSDNNIKVTVKAGELTEVRFGNKKVGEVLGKVTQLPDTGPGLILALLGASIPAGVYLKRLKRQI